MNLSDTKVLVGVTGGIAAYKTPDLVRRLQEAGAHVRVVMTEGGTHMVSPTVFQAVSGEPVRADLWDDQAEAAMGHIELARWADLILVAPATAHFMAQLAAGLAPNLLTTLCLATDAPVVLAPAMNRLMWSHPATRSNRDLLTSRGVRLLGPGVGAQACGETGPGRMLEPAEILALLDEGPVGLLAGLSVLITAGPTREAIDPVRFVSNRSSGKMGFAVASAASKAGARVTLVAGPVNIPTPAGVQRIDVESAAEMYQAAMDRAMDADIYVGAAAISDYRPEQVHDHKIKKHSESLSLDMVKSPDLLADIAALGDGPFTVGFAAETEKLEEHALIKLQKKKLNMIVANQVGAKLCFDQDDNSALVLWNGGSQALERAPKTELAHRIVEVVAARYADDRGDLPKSAAS